MYLSFNEAGLTGGSTRTPTLAMASPFYWPVLVPYALRAPAPVNLGVRPHQNSDTRIARHRKSETRPPNTLMNAATLWKSLQSISPERTARVMQNIDTESGTAEELLLKLQNLSSNARVANGRCGYSGNPYEQLDEDFSVLLDLARTINIKEST